MSIQHLNNYRNEVVDLINANEANIAILQAETSEMSAGAGFTGGTGTIYQTSVTNHGGLITTRILVDLTGLRSTASGDIIGVDGTASVCHLGQITAAVNGTVVAGRIKCFETPAGSTNDIDLYSATEGTGVEDTAISTLTETQLVNAGAHSAGSEDILTALPAADEYLYLVAGATLDADYTAGILMIELWGYSA